jgi:hypothetical protein
MHRLKKRPLPCHATRRKTQLFSICYARDRPAVRTRWIRSKISNFLFAAAHIWNHNALGSAQASRRVTDLNVGPNPTLPRGWGFRLFRGSDRIRAFNAVPRSADAVVGYDGPPDIDRNEGGNLGQDWASCSSSLRQRSQNRPHASLVWCGHLPRHTPLGAASEAAPIDCQPSDLSKTVFNALNVQQRPFE